ncbi:MAG: protein transporter Sec31 [Streptomyces sp.]|nr:protein transporter Sec31 [Streptomyces sp.]NUP36178.1 protein transporter Sec31 [Streptomyces sp.]NUS75525.1 protein transporter Sec31 [Streptomyces sp.]
MKTRRITRERLVPHTLDGTTRMVPEEYTVDLPIPPRDWDQIGINVVTGIVTIALLGCMAFSTASIGDLLSRVVPRPAAYGAAALFDLAWIGCSIIEWLARYTPERATTARTGGYVALAVAMGAVASHGWLAGGVATGLVGAAASGLAKGLWAIVLDYQAAPLSKRDAAFFEQELSEAAVELARVPVRRRVIRARALAAAERIALEADRGSVDPDRTDESTDDPDADIIDIHPGAVSTKDAVRIAWDSDVRDRDAVIRYVAKATGRAPSPDTVDRYLRALRVGA